MEFEHTLFERFEVPQSLERVDWLRDLVRAGVAARPVDRHVCNIPISLNHDSLDELPDNQFAILRCGFGGTPNRWDHRRKRTDGVLLFRRQQSWLFEAKTVIFLFQLPLRTHLRFPALLQVSDNKAVLRFHGIVLPVGSFSLIPHALQSLLPVSVKLVAIPLNISIGPNTEFDRGWFENAQDLLADKFLQWIPFQRLALLASMIDGMLQATVSNQRVLFVLHDHPGAEDATDKQSWEKACTVTGGAIVSRRAASSLIFIDHHYALAGPSQTDCVIYQCVLPLS
jgi:hypothetical protein